MNEHPIGILEAPNLSGETKSSGAWNWLSQNGTMVLVLACLGGISFVGHHTGWSLAGFQHLIGKESPKDGTWCQEHSVPESECVECHESLLPRTKSTWCRKHGVHDCPFERPEVVQTKCAGRRQPTGFRPGPASAGSAERKENSSKSHLHHRRIQFASEEALKKMKLDAPLPVERGPIVESIRASGEIAFEQPARRFRVGAGGRPRLDRD